MNDLHLSAFAPRWRFLYAARFDAYEDSLSVGAISLEYIVTLTEMKEAIVVPAWRFNLGADNDSLEINRRRVLAIDATTGNLIQGERGMNF